MGTHAEKKTETSAGTQRGAPAPKAGAESAGRNPQQNYLQQVQRDTGGTAGAGGAGDPSAPGAGPEKPAGEGAPGDAGQKTGLQNYEATLGKFLGGKLYGAVADAVKLDKMSGYAHGALDAAIDQIVAAVGDASGPEFEQKAAPLFDQALTQVLGPYVDQFMEGPGKDLTASLQSWVDANPRAVAALAVLAAIGTVASNALIPKLKAKIKIAPGVEASIEAKLGRFQAISLEQIKGQIEARREFDGAHVRARLEYVHDKEKGDSFRGEIKLQAPDGRWIVGLGAGKDRTGESLDGFIERSWPKDNLSVELRARMHSELGSQVMFGLKWKF